MSSNQDKHTPGPWKIKRRKHSEFSFWHYTIEHTSTYRDCFVVREMGSVWRKPTKGKPYRNKEALANARLIAAAPELLETAKHIAKQIARNPDLTGVDSFFKAIAKAEGRE